MAFDYGGIIADCILHCVTDYSTQISYLNAMEEALLAAGFNRSATINAIHKLRREYDDKFYYAAAQVGEKLADKLFGKVEKQVVGSVPGLGLAENIMGAYSKTMRMVYASDISADKALMGLQQYDAGLTRAYQKYVDLMAEGKATVHDMEQAEKIYTLLGAVKQKEYKAMMQLTKDVDQILYHKYSQKYDALTNEFGLSTDGVKVVEFESPDDNVCPNPSASYAPTSPYGTIESQGGRVKGSKYLSN